MRKLHPSVSRALPPVGWQSTVEQPLQMTTVCAWLKTVVLRKREEQATTLVKEVATAAAIERAHAQACSDAGTMRPQRG